MPSLAGSTGGRSPVAETLWECPSVPMFVIDVGADGEFRFENVNPACEERSGFTYALLVGRTPEEATSIVTPEGAAAMRENYTRCVALGRSIQYEERMDIGGYERYWRTQLVPYHAPSGRIEKLVGIAIEITQQVRETRELAESKARISALLEAANEGVWLVGALWQTTYVNPALSSMLGYSGDELRVMRIEEIVPKEDAAWLAAAMREIEAGRAGVGEVRLCARDGREVWALYSAAPIRGPDGAFHGAVAMLNDITGQKHAESRARDEEGRMRDVQRLESLGVLAGGIAHDFNNLLSGILGNTNLLRAELPETSGAQETLQTIELAASRAALLCKQLLAYSGRGRYDIAPLDLSKLVGETLELLRSSVDRRHRLDLSLAPDLPVASADAAQLQQVVMNLVINASEALGDAPGTVRVSTSCVPSASLSLEGAEGATVIATPEALVLTVDDQGPGMSAAVQARIFEPFFTTKAQGRGLGLSAVLGIVRGHGGALRVRSAPGEGTTFDLVLPASGMPVQKASRARPSTPAPGGATEGGGRIVLVIDDEPLVRRTARRILEQSGYVVLEGEDGQDGLEMLHARGAEIWAILLDLTMPRRDGFAVLKQVREERPALPVVLTSGYTEHEADDLTGGGPLLFLPKPFTRTALLAAFARLREGSGPG